MDAPKPKAPDRNLEAINRVKREHACVVCGERNSAKLTFHHREHRHGQGNTVYELAINGATPERLMEEIAQCDVICRSCHSWLHRQQGLTAYPLVHKRGCRDNWPEIKRTQRALGLR